jgi:hypothetical protein
MSKNDEEENNKIKLYSYLVDELFKHQTNIWQIPIALLSVNLIAIYNFKSQGFPLIILWLFNAGLIFVFYQMIKAQMKIIETIRNAEKELGPTYAVFLPNIDNPRLKSPYVFLGILILLETIFAVYIISLFLSFLYLLPRAC